MRPGFTVTASNSAGPARPPSVALLCRGRPRVNKRSDTSQGSVEVAVAPAMSTDMVGAEETASH